MPISFCFSEMSFSLLGKKEEAIDKIRRNSVRNEALNDFLRSISDFCDRLSSVSSLPLSSIQYGIRPFTSFTTLSSPRMSIFKRRIRIKLKIFFCLSVILPSAEFSHSETRYLLRYRIKFFKVEILSTIRLRYYRLQTKK